RSSDLQVLYQGSAERAVGQGQRLAQRIGDGPRHRERRALQEQRRRRRGKVPSVADAAAAQAERGHVDGRLEDAGDALEVHFAGAIASSCIILCKGAAMDAKPTPGAEVNVAGVVEQGASARLVNG